MDRYEALEILKVCSNTCMTGVYPGVHGENMDMLRDLHSKALETLLNEEDWGLCEDAKMCKPEEGIAVDPAAEETEPDNSWGLFRKQSEEAFRKLVDNEPPPFIWVGYYDWAIK